VQGNALDLRNKKLTQIDNKLFSHKALQVIDLSDNPGLVEIPS